MPEPGQTPQPAIKRGSGPDALPQGAAGQANALLSSGAMPFDDQTADLIDDEDDEAFSPADDEEAFIFGASDRPSEPITAGMPLGPGPSMVPLPNESRTEFVGRVATRLETEFSNVPGMKKAIAKMRKGL